MLLVPVFVIKKSFCCEVKYVSPLSKYPWRWHGTRRPPCGNSICCRWHCRHTFTLVQHIKQARAIVQGSSKSLHTVPAKLGAISPCLHEVEMKPQIQTVVI